MPSLGAPITNATSEGLIKQAAVIRRQIYKIQADEGDLSRLGIVEDGGALNNQGATTQTVTHMEMSGQGGMKPMTETESVTPSTTNATSLTLSAARYAVDLPISDRVRSNNMLGVNEAMLGSLIVERRRVTRNTNMCAAWEAATNVVGTSGAAFTATHLFEAQAAARIAKIRPAANGLYAVVISPEQANELDTSARGLGNILRERPDIQEFSRFMPGTFLGVFDRCAVYQIDTVQDDGTDYAGALLGEGALHSKYVDQALPAPGNFAQKFLDLPGFMLEIERTGRAALTSVIGNDYHGYTAYDPAIVRLRSAAS